MYYTVVWFRLLFFSAILQYTQSLTLSILTGTWSFSVEGVGVLCWMEGRSRLLSSYGPIGVGLLKSPPPEFPKPRSTKESRPLLRSTPMHLGSYSLSYQGFYYTIRELTGACATLLYKLSATHTK